MKEIGKLILKQKNVQFGGVGPRYRDMYECITYKNLYPKIDGFVRCNGRAL